MQESMSLKYKPTQGEDAADTKKRNQLLVSEILHTYVEHARTRCKGLYTLNGLGLIRRRPLAEFACSTGGV